MTVIEKSESIRAGLRKGFQDGTSKMAQRRCYGYDTGPDSGLVINPDEAAIVRWIFDRYLNGDSLGKIAAGLEKQGIPSPTSRSKWNREAINKLISNEKYTGWVLLQKTISVGDAKIKNDGIMDRYLYSDSHEAIIWVKILWELVLKYPKELYAGKKELKSIAEKIKGTHLKMLCTQFKKLFVQKRTALDMDFIYIFRA